MVLTAKLFKFHDISKNDLIWPFYDFRVLPETVVNLNEIFWKEIKIYNVVFRFGNGMILFHVTTKTKEYIKTLEIV